MMLTIRAAAELYGRLCPHSFRRLQAGVVFRAVHFQGTRVEVILALLAGGIVVDGLGRYEGEADHHRNEILDCSLNSST